ncbi:MAG: TlpA disulfide reductase family protein [Rhodococcus sp. (in: high G+C Gram-positive bacteria)]|uniref:TlpA family protein disulfide reductase n=1 Tax=Rhodococcus sp. TaxID=1831 RepID=UPI003BB1787F
MSSAARWSLATLVVVVALVVAIWPRNDGEAPSYEDRFGSGARTTASVTADPEALSELRSAAGLTSCPTPSGASTQNSVLSGIVLECVGDGSPVDLASALAGTPALVNLWAYWCEPCAEELPYMQQFSDRAGDAVTVLTVHTDPDESRALSRLIDYAVTLPGVQDGDGRVRAAVEAPAVLPVSVLVRADGTVAKIVPQPFRSVDEIAAAVQDNLGVAA